MIKILMMDDADVQTIPQRMQGFQPDARDGQGVGWKHREVPRGVDVRVENETVAIGVEQRLERGAEGVFGMSAEIGHREIGASLEIPLDDRSAPGHLRVGIGRGTVVQGLAWKGRGRKRRGEDRRGAVSRGTVEEEQPEE